MSKDQMFRGRTLLGPALCVASALVVNASVPRGWMVRGSKPAEYEVGIDADQACQDHAGA